jgi:hypothetical protein
MKSEKPGQYRGSQPSKFHVAPRTVADDTAAVDDSEIY